MLTFKIENKISSTKLCLTIFFQNLLKPSYSEGILK